MVWRRDVRGLCSLCCQTTRAAPSESTGSLVQMLYVWEKLDLSWCFIICFFYWVFLCSNPPPVHLLRIERFLHCETNNVSFIFRGFLHPYLNWLNKCTKATSRNLWHLDVKLRKSPTFDQVLVKMPTNPCRWCEWAAVAVGFSAWCYLKLGFLFIANPVVNLNRSEPF